MVEILGTCDPAFGKLKDQFAKQIQQFGGGASACVYHHGEKVVDMWGGVAGNDQRPWQQDTLALVYSATKAVPATCLHMLESDGLLDYDLPVAEYWPEFAQHGKDKITVRQLLSHQAGLYQVLGLIERPSDILDWEAMVDALAGAKPVHEPGEANGYHAFNIGWLVGALIEKISGEKFETFLKTRLTDPLGVDGLVIGVEEQNFPRLSDLMGMPSIREYSKIRYRYSVPPFVPRGPLRRVLSRGLTPRKIFNYFGDPEFYRAKIPAANGTFDARSLAKMYAMLANWGEFEGHRFMSPATIAKAREVQTKRFDRVAIYPLHWRLGYHRADAIIRNYPTAFGHYGFGGAGGWANPEQELAFGLVHNSSPFTLLGHIRCIAITGSVYHGAKLADKGISGARLGTV
ncbi:MAG: beta-lactamase family protein [Pseudomonadales bacterium]|nr:beta-lactamase family protein [Pseudomonadales bacterium]